MTGALSPRHIVRMHVRTFALQKPYRGYDWSAILWCYGAPALGAIALVATGCRLTSGQEGAFMNAAAIFAGLLLNLLALLFTVDLRVEPTAHLERMKAQLEKSIYANVSYAIFISIAIVLLLLVSSMVRGGLSVFIAHHFVNAVHDGLVIGISALAYALCLHLGMTLLLILKGIHALTEREHR